MRIDILERKEEILSWIDEELTLYEMKIRLNCKYETLRRYLKEMGIEYAGQQSRKGQQKGPNKYKDSSYYTVKNGPVIHSAKLREKLVREGKKQNKCEICGNDSWFGNAIPLELHHKDGDHFNNELDNLQILCPNCHAVFAPNSGSAKNKKCTRKPTLSAEELAQQEAHRKQKARERELRRKQKLKEQAELRAAHPEQVDTFGRVNERMLTAKEWVFRKELILNSGVDLQKFGWKTKVQEATGLTRRQVDNTIEHFVDEFKDKIYIR